MKLPAILAAMTCLFPAFARAEETTAPAKLPTLFIIGDSTVKNGSGKGDGGLWGWGAPIAEQFDNTADELGLQERHIARREVRSLDPPIQSGEASGEAVEWTEPVFPIADDLHAGRQYGHVLIRARDDHDG